MILRFPIRRINAKPNLAAKLKILGKEPFIQRVLADIKFVGTDGIESNPVSAIVDTGALISLFPITFLQYYPGLKVLDHTLWGIVDAPECHVQAKIGVVEIRLIDISGTASRRLSVVDAFSTNESIPILIGMKDIIGTFSSKINARESVFELELDGDL